MAKDNTETITQYAQRVHPDRTLIIIEGDGGSSFLDIHIQNADPVQLFAAAGIIDANARIGLAGQMAHAAMQERSPLVSVKGSLHD